MQKMDGVQQTTALVVDLRAATISVHGRELELPFREFRLVAELAQHVGEPISSKRLIEEIWPDEPWTPMEMLYNLITRVRRLVDGPEKFGASIRNRRGLGYVLDLPSSQVVVIGPYSDDAVIRLDDDTGPVDTAVRSDEVVEEADELVAASRPRGRRWLWAAAVIAAIGMSWSAGYLLSTHSAAKRSPTVTQENRTASKPDHKTPRGSRPISRSKHTARHTPQHRHKHHRPPRRNHVVAMGPSSSGLSSSTGSSGVANPVERSHKVGHDTSEKAASQPKPALPPAPTRYLYALVNPKTGDHFVTTDGGTASEYQAKGYRGGAIAFVYTSQEKSTKAISTDAGTAYIFVASGAKTRPASRTVALWYSTDGAGDFFYSTDPSEAQQSGWHASVIGYVRSL